MIAVTAKGEGPKSNLDSRFGRCEYIVMYDLNTETYSAQNNPSKTSSGGAGVSTAQLLSELKVTTLITGNVGPKAMRALKAADIEVFTSSGGTVEEVIKLYQKGKLQQVMEATVKEGRR